MKTSQHCCKHCNQPLLELKCDRCFGHGYVWVQDECGDTPMLCPTCSGLGYEYPCTNTDCPGIAWYPLSRRDSAILRMVVRNVSEDEKLRS